MHANLLKSIPQLETDRLVLRELTETDTRDLFKVFADPLVTRYYDTDTFETAEQAAAMIAGFRRRLEAGAGIRWGIVRKSDQVLIGSCGLPSSWPDIIALKSASSWVATTGARAS